MSNFTDFIGGSGGGGANLGETVTLSYNTYTDSFAPNKDKITFEDGSVYLRENIVDTDTSDYSANFKCRSYYESKTDAEIVALFPEACTSAVNEVNALLFNYQARRLHVVNGTTAYEYDMDTLAYITSRTFNFFPFSSYGSSGRAMGVYHEHTGKYYTVSSYNDYRVYIMNSDFTYDGYFQMHSYASTAGYTAPGDWDVINITSFSGDSKLYVYSHDYVSRSWYSIDLQANGTPVADSVIQLAGINSYYYGSSVDHTNKKLRYHYSYSTTNRIYEYDVDTGITDSVLSPIPAGNQSYGSAYNEVNSSVGLLGFDTFFSTATFRAYRDDGFSWSNSNSNNTHTHMRLL